MLELIDKEATLKKMCELCGNRCEKFEEAMRTTHPDFVTYKCSNYRFLSEQPTIDAEPVRHGQWIEDGEICGMGKYKCSLCGGEVGGLLDNTKYCCFCGAKMSGGVDND